MTSTTTLQHRPWRATSIALAALVLAASASAQQAAAPLTTPAIPGVVSGGTPIELIREGFSGTEGPVGLPDGSLIFTETTANRITRIAADGSMTWHAMAVI
jgi:gluconolactonase